MPVSIVIVNWNAGSQLAEAITSIALHHRHLVDSVIIVDNASSDDSLAQVEAIHEFPFMVKFVRNDANYGFARACNQGARLSTSDYLLFLNPDAALYADTLPKVVSFMQDVANSQIGICGVQLLDKTGQPGTAAARFPTLGVLVGKITGLSLVIPRWIPSHLMHPSELIGNCTVDQIIGAFFLIRRHLFEQCSGFDERFFVYYEEVDLALRAKSLGYSSFYLASVNAFHSGGGTTQSVKALRLFYSLRSRIIYAEKHYNNWQFWTLITLTLSVEFGLRMAHEAFKCSAAGLGETFSGYFMLAKHCCSSMKGSRVPR